jgi:hypothetical protein
LQKKKKQFFLCVSYSSIKLLSFTRNKILEAVGKKYVEYEDKNDGKYEIIIFKAYLRIYYLNIRDSKIIIDK